MDRGPVPKWLIFFVSRGCDAQHPMTRASCFGQGICGRSVDRKLSKGALKTLRGFLQLPLKSLNLFRYIF
jgi:hypothetical protein